MIVLNAQLFYPMFALFLLTLTALIRMFLARVKAVKSGQLKINDFKVYTTPQPDEVIKMSRHFTNLFEVPVLFYLVCLLGMVLGMTSLPFMILAWAYVFARVVHSIVHTGSNNVILRMRVYGLGWVFLTLMWLIMFFRVFQGSLQL